MRTLGLDIHYCHFAICNYHIYFVYKFYVSARAFSLYAHNAVTCKSRMRHCISGALSSFFATPYYVDGNKVYVFILIASSAHMISTNKRRYIKRTWRKHKIYNATSNEIRQQINQVLRKYVYQRVTCQCLRWVPTKQIGNVHQLYITYIIK